MAAAGLLLAACSTGKDVANKSTTTTLSVSASTTTDPAGGSTTTTTTPPPTTTTIPPFTIPVVHTGTGPATLAQFSVPSKAPEWDIDWVFNCSVVPTKTGTFDVAVVGHGSAANTTDAGVTEQGNGTAGIVKNYDTGTFNLKVTTACKWTVRVEILS
jgi:hypothetical protein